jgi:membrane protein YdbS with pleckstrin-like domain
MPTFRKGEQLMFDRRTYEVLGGLYVILLILFLVLEYAAHPPFILTSILAIMLLALLVAAFVAIIVHTRHVHKEEESHHVR